MKNIIIALFCIAILVSTSCKQNENTETISMDENQSTSMSDNKIRVSHEQFERSGYELSAPTMHRFDQVIRAAGEVHLPISQKAEVSTNINGTVGKVNYHVGEWVTQGQELFRITNPELIDIQEQYLLNKANLSYKINEAARLQTLVDEKLSPIAELTKLQADIQLLNTQIGAAHQKLKLYGIDVDKLSSDRYVSSIAIKAPKSGHILDLHITEGVYITPGMSMMTIANTSGNKVEVAVLEKNIDMVNVGQELHFYTQSEPSVRYRARIYLIDPVVGSDHTITAHCHILDKRSASLKSGTFVNAEIINESKETYALPTDGVVRLSDKSYALRLVDKTTDDYVFEKVEMLSGMSDEKFVEVVRSVEPNDQYLTKGAYFLIME